MMNQNDKILCLTLKEKIITKKKSLFYNLLLENNTYRTIYFFSFFVTCSSLSNQNILSNLCYFFCLMLYFIEIVHSFFSNYH